MHPRVGVLHTDAVSAKMALHDVHDCVVRVALRPIALPFEDHGQCRYRFGAGLNHPFNRVVMCKLADIAAAVLDHVYFVVVVYRLNGRQRHTVFRP